MRRVSKNRSLLITLLSITIIIIFQNCANYKFKSSGFNNTEVITGNGGNGTDDDFELIDFYINPLTSTSQPDIHVTTIMDNSNSMTLIQDKVQLAFSQVANQFRTFSGTLNLFTTTQDLSKDKPSLSLEEFITYIDSEGKEKKINLSSISEIPNETNYNIHKLFSLSAPFLPEKKALDFDSSMSDEEFSHVTDSFSKSITDIGIDGSDEEQGLCTLYRSIKNSMAKDEGGFHLYLLAANEDDDTKLEKCLIESQQEVIKTPQSTDQLVPCVIGDLTCSHEYEIAYKPHNKDVLAYNYRDIKEKYNYTLNQSLLKFDYKQYFTQIKYKYKTRKEVLTYEEYVLNDYIREPSGYKKTKTITNWVVGACPERLDLSCTEDEAKLIGVPLDSLFSCSYSCSNGTTESKYASKSSKFGGSCVGDGIPLSRGCNESEKNSVKGNYALSDTICDVVCSDENKSGNTLDFLSSVTCKSDSCDSTQLNFIKSKSEYSHLSDSDISCNQSCKTGSLSKDNLISACGGVLPDQSGSKTDNNCTDALKDKISSLTGITKSKISSCSYTCNQTQKPGEKALTNPSQCSVVSSPPDCTVSQTDAAATHLGRSKDFLSSCKYKCSQQTPIASCKKQKTGYNYCDSNIFPNENSELLAVCNKPGYSLNPSSCKVNKAEKSVGKITYKSESQPWEDMDLTEDPQGEKDNVVKTLEKVLHTAHGNNFFVGFYIYPASSLECDPPRDDSGHLIVPTSFGKKYEELSTLLGENQSAVNQICDSDYSDTLGIIFKQVTETVARSYEISVLEDSDTISEMFFVYDNGSREIVNSNLYQRDKKIITFNSEEILKDVKEIQVKVKRLKKK